MAELMLAGGGITSVTPPQPPTGTANPALCKECIAALRFDDGRWKMLRTVDGEPYLAAGRPSKSTKSDEMPPRVGPIKIVRYDHLPDLPALSLAAERGCVFCTAMRNGLQNKYGESAWWKPHPEPLELCFNFAWIMGMGPEFLDSVLVEVHHPEMKKWLKYGTLDFLAYASRDEDPCTRWLKLRPRLGDNPWSPDNISMSRTWIAECMGRTGLCRDRTVEVCDHASNSDSDSEAWQSEEYCSDSEIEANATAYQGTAQMSRICGHTNGTFVPARLLDLFPASVHAPGCISLVERIDLEKHVRYAALSYCWGDVKPTVLTTRANLDSHKKYIKLVALPQCLRDAVTVARSLEIQYLWIDALCIIQDDRDDWARESAAMSQLFQNAYITIAAAASESFDEGFLTPRPPFEGLDIDFSSALNPQIVGKITLSTVPTWRSSWTDNQLTADLVGCKWDRRGWVWQEQKLSKRLLVFGKRMIHFKCEHGLRSEDGSTRYVKGPPGDLWPTPDHLDRGSWTSLLADYTPKSFTFPQDKLPGISGLSKQINQNSISGGMGPAEYLAGIWYCSGSRWPLDYATYHQYYSSWQHQLFWGVTTPCWSFNEMVEQFKRSEPQTYIAPSWSWASCSGRVEWPEYEPHFDNRGRPSVFDEAKIEENHMNLTGPDPTGRVGPGSYLKLSGFMYRDPLDLSVLEYAGSIQFFQWYKHETAQFSSLDLSLDWKRTPTDQENHSYECEIRLFGLWRFRNILEDERLDRDEDSGEDYDSNYFHGLLLLRDKVSGSHFRVGTFRGKTYRKWPSLSSYDDQSQWLHEEGWDCESVYIL